MRIQDIIKDKGSVYKDNNGNIWRVGDNELIEVETIEVTLDTYYEIHEILELEFEKLVGVSDLKMDDKIKIIDECVVNNCHFAGITEDGWVKVWKDGKTSFTAPTKDSYFVVPPHIIYIPTKDGEEEPKASGVSKRMEAVNKINEQLGKVIAKAFENRKTGYREQMPEMVAQIIDSIQTFTDNEIVEIDTSMIDNGVIAVRCKA